MSATTGYTCLTCRCHAPAIGDFGLLGAPEIEPRADAHVSFPEETDTPTFGYFYEVLAGIGIGRPDLDDLATWLRAHKGHEIAIDFNGENPAVRSIDGDSDVRTRADTLWADCEARRAQALTNGTLVRGTYTVQCQDCDESVAAPEADEVRPLTAMRLAPGAVEAFVERWGDSDDMFAHRLGGALDQYEFIPDLVAFFEEHSGHDLIVTLEPDDEV